MDSLTEQHTVSWPIVCGYLRPAGLSTAKQRALTAAINQYCTDHELMLGGFFREDRASPDIAFSGLLQALTAGRMYGVIVPAATHLGPKGVAHERRRLIDAAGGRLLLMVGKQQRSASKAGEPHDQTRHDLQETA